MRPTICLATLAALAAASPSAAGTPGVKAEFHEASGTVAPSSLEGTWKTTKATLKELLAAGVPRKNAQALEGPNSPKTPGLVFRSGAFKGIDLSTGAVLSTGTYVLNGDVIRLVFTRDPFHTPLGVPYKLGWSVYRDRLRFSHLPGRPSFLLALTIHPWSRVR